MFNHQRSAKDLAISPDGTHLAIGGKSIRLHDMMTGACIMQLGDSDHITALTFLADNAYLASGTWSGRIFLWDVVTGICVLSLEGHMKWITSLSASPREPLLASASWDGTIRIWNTTSGECLHTYDVDASSLVFFPDGERLAIGCEDGWLRLWNCDTKEIQSHELRDAGYLWLAISNNGKLLAATRFGQSDVAIFDTTDFSPETVLDVGANEGRISFSPDNSQLLTVDDNSMRLWNIHSRECRSFKHERVENAAFTPDGTHIVSGREHCCLSFLYFSLANS